MNSPSILGFRARVSVLITTFNNISAMSIHQSNHGEVYAMEHYVIKFFSELQQGQWFSADTSVSSHNENDSHDIAEI
jgi:hypothetical protein